MNCKNCNVVVHGKYCSQCGQSSHVGKITFSSLLQEVVTNILQIDRGFFYTMKALLIRPGTSIRAYLIGSRKKHFKPIAYVLTFSTIYFLVSQITDQNTWLNELIAGYSSGAYDAGKSEQVPPVLIWFSKNFAFTTLLLLPVFSLASYISFRGLGENYFEHIVINSFITGQQAIIYSTFVLLTSIFKVEFFEDLTFVVAGGYTIWVYYKLFTEGRRIVNIFRSILTYVLYLLFCTGFLLAIGDFF